MLGENHSLTLEFPEHLQAIKHLHNTDRMFAKQADKYNTLDREIRKLELNNSPIEDGAMHALKHERAELKDVLFEQLEAQQKQ